MKDKTTEKIERYKAEILKLEAKISKLENN